jgi:hypothetical protein
VPSLPHELLVDILRERPGLLLSLLSAELDVVLPDGVAGREASASIVELQPAEYRADAVLVFSDAADLPLLAIVLEVQLRVDHEKAYAWPVYVAGVRARLRCPVVLAVLALDDEVSAWARCPIVLGPAGSTIVTSVVDSRVVPQIVEAEAARRDLELAMLSLLAHAKGPRAAEIGAAILRACQSLDLERSVFYTDVVLARLDPAALQRLEQVMNFAKYEFQSEFFRNAAAQGRRQGIAESILRVLEARGLVVSSELREYVQERADGSALERLLVLAATVDDPDALLHE